MNLKNVREPKKCLQTQKCSSILKTFANSKSVQELQKCSQFLIYVTKFIKQSWIQKSLQIQKLSINSKNWWISKMFYEKYICDFWKNDHEYDICCKSKIVHEFLKYVQEFRTNWRNSKNNHEFKICSCILIILQIQKVFKEFLKMLINSKICSKIKKC